jgi:conjugative transfer signal peptidase TraF
MKNTWRKLIVAILVLSLLGVITYRLGLRVNVTSSLPVGLYRLTNVTPRRGDLVAFNLPEDNPYATIARSRNYGGSNIRPFLKRLAAVPGDIIKIGRQGLCINDRIIPNSAFHNWDKMGRPLPRYLVAGTVPTGKALVLSGYNPMSFDGRYFGLLDLDDLQKVIPVSTFN